MLHGGNPYLAAPLYACESSPAPARIYSARDGVALPAPLPGYAFVPFALLSMLPIAIATIVWLLMLLAAVALAVRSCAQLGVSAAAALAAFALPLGLTVLPYGEIVPIALAACSACAVALRRRSYGPAVAWAAIAMIEPHVGLPVLLALVGIEATRLRAAFAIVVLATLHALLAHDAAVTYFTQLLPQHALAELMRSSQYSFSWVLAQLGVMPGFALGIGTVAYALALGGGIMAAALVSRSTRSLDAYAIVPPAFALFGGTFMHIAQTALALPAALLLFTWSHGRLRTLSATALLLLAIPWSAAIHTPFFVLFAAAAATIVATIALKTTPIVSLRIGLASTVVAAGLNVASWFPGSPADLPMPHLDPAFAEAGWAAWVHAHDRYAGIAVWFAKLPTWAGLIILACIALQIQRHALPFAGKERVRPPAKDDAPIAVSP